VTGVTTIRDPAAGPQEAEAFRLHAELCKVLTDPKRLMILQALRAGERSVGELADVVGMSLPNASQHLSVMRHAGLVATRRDGTTVFYSLAEPRIAQACDIVHQIVLDRMPEARSHRSH
jgi:ArsR family transcriptional regulator